MRAGILYYALVVSLIISLIIGALFFSISLNQQLLFANNSQEELIWDVNSAVELYCANPSMIEKYGHTTLDLYSTGEDTVHMNLSPWGMLDVLQVTTRWRKHRYNRCYLMGALYQETEPVSMYVTDKGKYLSISGNSLIAGPAYLPKLGIRKAYIEGEPFRGDQAVYGAIKESEKQLPLLNEARINVISDYLFPDSTTFDSIVPVSVLQEQDEINRSFHESPLVIYNNERTVLRQVKINGHVIVWSNEDVIIHPSAQLEDILVMARSVYIEDGFEGSLQAFASDTLLVGEDCTFHYPSFLGVVNPRSGNSMMHLFEGTEVNGGVTVVQEMSGQKPAYLGIGEDVIVRGQVYCLGNMEMKGMIHGSLYVDLIRLKTPSAYYENHLLDMVVDFEKLPPYYAGYNVLGTNSRKAVIKCLY